MITDVLKQRFVNWAVSGTPLMPDPHFACGAHDMSLQELEAQMGRIFRERWEIQEIIGATSVTFLVTSQHMLSASLQGGTAPRRSRIRTALSYNLQEGQVEITIRRLGIPLLQQESLKNIGEFATLGIIQANGDFLQITCRREETFIEAFVSRRMHGVTLERIATLPFNFIDVGSLSIKTMGKQAVLSTHNSSVDIGEIPILDNARVYIEFGQAVLESHFILFDTFSAQVPNSMQRATVVESEKWRERFLTREILPPTSLLSRGNSVSIGTRFSRLRGTGLWREAAILTAPQIQRSVDTCDRDTGWTTGASNSIFPQFADVAEGSGSLIVTGDNEIRFVKSTMMGATGDTDVFDSFNTVYWHEDIVGGSTKTITNVGRLILTIPAINNQYYVATRNAVNLDEDFEFSVDVVANDVAVAALEISQFQRPSPGNWLHVRFEHPNTVRVRSSALGESASLAIPSITGTLRMRKLGANIAFFHNETQVFSTTWTSFNIGTSGRVGFLSASGTTKTGSTTFDNFLSTFNRPMTTANAHLQFFYKVTEELAKRARGPEGSFVAQGPSAVRIGNSPTSYWEFVRPFGDSLTWGDPIHPGVFFPIVPNEWNFVSLLLSRAFAVGSPTLSRYLRYFELNYGGIGIPAPLSSFTDSIDYLRLFAHNGDMLLYNNFPLPVIKGTAENRQLAWNIHVSR